MAIKTEKSQLRTSSPFLIIKFDLGGDTSNEDYKVGTGRCTRVK